MVAQATCCGFWASRQLAQVRGISLKRDPALPTHLLLCSRLARGRLAWASTSRLSETPQPERDPSAWARCWARLCCVGMSIGPWMICFGWVWLYEEWSVYIMEHEVYFWHDSWICGWGVGMRLSMRNERVVWNLRNMVLTWVLHEFVLRGLVWKKAW